MAPRDKAREQDKVSTARRRPRQKSQPSNEHARPSNSLLARGRAASELGPADLLSLQRTVGNRAVVRMLGLPSRAAPSQPPLQRKAEEEEESEVVQMKENRTGLPDDLKAGVENLSGLSMDDVKVHYNSSKPAEVQALAYTQGTDIHVGPGQERHLPHEAWHVVQQKQGRVKPTLQGKGRPINDDARLESEADRMGDLLTRGGSRRRGRHDAAPHAQPPRAGVIQRVIHVENEDKRYTAAEMKTRLEADKDVKIDDNVMTNLLNFDYEKKSFQTYKKFLTAVRRAPKALVTAKRMQAEKKAATPELTKEELAAKKEKELKAIEDTREENRRMKAERGHKKIDNLNKASNYAKVSYTTLPAEVKETIGKGHGHGTENVNWWPHQTNPVTGKAGVGIKEYKPRGNASPIRLVGHGALRRWYYCPDHTIHGNYTYHEITDIPVAAAVTAPPGAVAAPAAAAAAAAVPADEKKT